MGNEFGKHPQLTFVNGSATEPIDADNLNEMERMHEIVDNELARSASKDFSKYKEYFFNRNCKQIESFQDNTDWTAGASTTLSDDTSNTFLGSASVKCAENDNTASYVSMYQTVAAIDLTKFNDGSASSVYDCIALTFYISDYTKLNTISIHLGTDATNYYGVSYSSFSNDGWTTVFPMKDDFSSVGSPDWSSITYIRIRWYSENSASGEYISPQVMSLYRKDPLYGTQYYNPFQNYKGSITGWDYNYIISVDAFLLVYDPLKCELGCIMGTWYEQNYNNRSLRVLEDIISFTSEIEVICKRDDEGPSITWWYSNNYYLMAYVESNRLYIKEVVGGSPTTSYVDLDTNLYYNQRYNMYVEKHGDTFRAIMKKNGESTKVLEYETTINSEYDGDVYIGHEGIFGPGLITDFKFTYTENFDQKNWDMPQVKIKQVDEVVNNSTTFQDDNELYIWLSPNSLFEIEMYLIVDATNDTPDIQFQWDATNLTIESARFPLGPDLGSTTGYNTNIRMGAATQFTSNVDMGVPATAWVVILDRFIVSSGNDGGFLFLQWAQDTAHASDTTVKAGSYLKATKVKTN